MVAKPDPRAAEAQGAENVAGSGTPFGGPVRVVGPLCAVFRQGLRAAGLRYTNERAQILDVVMAFAGAFDAEAVIARVRHGRPRASKATVYRTLHLLQESGIIERVLHDDDHARYVLAGSGAGSGHAVVVRLDSDDVVAVDIPELAALRDAVCARLGLRARGHRLQIFARAAGPRE